MYKKAIPVKKKFLLLFISFSIFCGCTTPGSSSHSLPPDTSSSSVHSLESKHFSSYLDTVFQTIIVSNTLNMHYTLSAPEDFGIKEYPVSLGHLTEQDSHQSLAQMENIYNSIKKYDYEELSSENRLTYDLLSSYFDLNETFSNYYLYDELLKPGSGIQAELPILLAEYQFYDKEDVTDYLTLLADIERYFDEIIEFEIAKSDAGLFMPDFAVDTVLKGCSDFCATNGKEHYLVTTFREKVSAMTQLSEEDKTTFINKNESLVNDRILPAYEGLSEALTTLKGTGKNEKGLCYLPKGKVYYSNLVHACTGSSHTVEELEDMTQRQREKDLTTMSKLLKKNPDITAQSKEFSIDTSQPEQVVNYLVEKIKPDFPVPANTNYSLKYVDKCMQKNMAPAFYLTAPIDDLSQNAIYINPSSKMSGIKLFTTLAHEGFPGHMYQTTMSYQSNPAPIRCILNYPGYTEGWATYVEMLSYSYAGLSPDAAMLQRCNHSALLSLYASCDMGIHYDGWSLSDMIRFLRNYGIKDVNTIQNMYEYIISEPANYLKYYVGYLEFLTLREHAKERYGEKYSNKKFHEAIINIGPAPFDILEKYLDDYYHKSK